VFDRVVAGAIGLFVGHSDDRAVNGLNVAHVELTRLVQPQSGKQGE
jgi:hypothetical protein